MKRAALLLVLGLLFGANSFAQQEKYTTYYYQRATLFEQLPITSTDIVFLGNSLTDGCEWAELFGNPHIKNRGISGDEVMGIYDRIDPILKGKPAKIFLLTGVNDVSHDTLPIHLHQHLLTTRNSRNSNKVINAIKLV
jgi:lysophospholipase L1-like esterase